MKIYIMLLCLVLNVFADVLKIENFRTDLYSKTGANTLKKVEFSLELHGKELNQFESKIKDALLSVISAFFYEDIFTELGKEKFKNTFLSFSNKKYQSSIDSVFFLSLKSIDSFDLEEFKAYLEDVEHKKSKGQLKEQKSPQPKDFNTSLPNSLLPVLIDNLNNTQNELF